MKKMFSMFAFVAVLGLGMSAMAAKPEKAEKTDKAEKADKVEKTDKAAGKEVTVKGTAKCAKCSLKEADKCQATLVTKDGDKEVKYFVTGKEGSALHKEICTADKENVTVTGKVTEKDGKKMIAASKVE